MADEKVLFPADCVAKFPTLHVFGQFSDKSKKEDIEAFLTKYGIESEYVGVSVTAPAAESRPAEGVVVIKVKGVANHAIVPFGMLLAISDGSKDFMVIHPQVFVTFYDIPAETVTTTVSEPATETSFDAGELK